MKNENTGKSLTPLHKTVHWRRFRNIVNLIEKLEKLDFSNYNLGKVRCYRTVGIEMQGRNVHYNTESGNSCFVTDNHYDMFEIPNLTNTQSNFGNYIFVAHNTSFDYWICGELDVKHGNKNIENVIFSPFGFYDIAVNNKKMAINKKTYGENTDIGSKYDNVLFDNIGSRKRVYKTSNSEVLGKKYGISHNSKNIKDGRVVKIYKKKNPKNVGYIN